MGAWQEIVDYTFTANETSRTFSGLSITKDDFIKIIVTQVNGSASGSALRIFPNTAAGVSGHDTNTNYHLQILQGDGSSVVAGRSNDSNVTFVAGSSTNYSLIYFKLSENDRANFFSNNFRTIDSSLLNRFFYTTSSGVTFPAAITSLTFTADVTNGIGTGSRIQIYKLAAVKVADFVTTSNSTQVNIPFPTGTFSPAIDKDSEYLLVSDISNTSAGSGYFLTPNDLTTNNGYHTQEISGNGSTASASRFNEPNYVSITQNTVSLIYTHIKLSNIGSYTHQSYSLRNVGRSDIIISNRFASSTAENITSITKLNIIASATNAIGAGSRFTLYKLYK